MNAAIAAVFEYLFQQDKKVHRGEASGHLPLQCDNLDLRECYSQFTESSQPDKQRSIYEIFNYQIAYEIRLKQALEENVLCPFHYFGMSDISIVEDKQIKSKKITASEFNQLASRGP